MRQTSKDRILTTHTGSLRRPPNIVGMLKSRESGEPGDRAGFEEAVARATADLMRWQVAAGIDIVNDGEVGKTSYATYIQERLSGFGPLDEKHWRQERHREHDAFPDYYARTAAAAGPETRRKLGCVGPVAMVES